MTRSVAAGHLFAFAYVAAPFTGASFEVAVYSGGFTPPPSFM
jgi:hypothetical protein